MKNALETCRFRGWNWFFAGLLIALFAPMLQAHEVPNDVKIQAFLRVQDDRLNLLIRVPMDAMREVEFPLRGPGYLDFPKLEPALRQAATLWLSDKIRVWEGGRLLGTPVIQNVRISLPSDTAFARFDTASAHLQRGHAPLAGDLVWHQQFMDVAFEYATSSAQSRFKVHFELDRLGLDVITVLRFLLPGGTERAYELHGNAGVVELDPSFWGAALRFFSSGFGHILSGLDHVLFLACLLLATRSLYPILVMATSFTVGHSVTLIASVFGIVPSGLWFAPWVESAIAASVFYMALENILRSQSRSKPRGRWLLCAAFGMIHGFGFSFALKESLQFAGDHLTLSLLSFNLGVEAGQIVLLLVGVPALRGLLGARSDRIGTLLLSALIAHTAWHWTVTRAELAFKFLPPLTPDTVAHWLGSSPAAVWLGLLVIALATLSWANKSLKAERQRSGN